MTVTEAIESRRSIKHFDPTHRLTAEETANLLRLARLAPSSFNMQNYRFVLVQDAELRKAVRAAAWDQSQITDASLVVILCANLAAHTQNPGRYWAHAPQPVQDFLVPAMGSFYGDDSRLIRDEGMRSSALAGMTLMLAAREMGLDSCPMVGFDAKAVSELIRLPADHAISFIVAIGKKSQEVWSRGERLPVEETVITDRF
jgi:nitroreductase